MNIVEQIDSLIERIQLAPRVNFRGGLDKYARIQIGHYSKLEKVFKSGLDSLEAMDRYERKNDTGVLSDMSREIQSIDRAPFFLELGMKAAKRLADVYKSLASASPEHVKTNIQIASDSMQIHAKELERWIDIAKAISRRETQSAIESFKKDWGHEDSPSLESVPLASAAYVELYDRIVLEKEKIDEITKSMKSDYVPEHEKTETLYHASTNARALMSKGFTSRNNDDVGLGGGIPDGQASFTTDLFVAKEIARSFKEVVLIARGEVTANDIMDWAKREGVFDKVWTRTMEWMSEFMDRDEYYNKVELSKEKLATILREPHQAMKVYDTYLHAQNKRYNPVFSGITTEAFTKKMAKKSVKDVGVLVCTVDMTNSAKFSYLHAEREFRIPVSAIISIDKVIR